MVSDLPYDPSCLSVLVIDDHPPMRKAIGKILRKMKFSVICEASNGAEAIKFLEENNIDLLICDIYMNNVSGFEVLKFVRYREINSDIPFVVVTGEGSKEDIIKAVDLGANDYIVKPFQAEDFEKKITGLLIKYHSPSPKVLALRKAERSLFEKRHEEALVLIEQALSAEPESVPANYLKGLALFRLGKVAEAAKCLEQNIFRNQNYYRNYATLGEVYLRQNKSLDAISAIQKELQFNGKQPLRHVKVAKLLLDNANTQGAIEHFREALKEDPKFAPALYGMGQAYAAAENMEKSVYYFKRMRRYYPEERAALEAMVRYCVEAKDPRRAEFALKDEKNHNPKQAAPYLVLAKLYDKTDRREEAIGVLDELLVKHPDNVEALRLKAMIYVSNGEAIKAVEVFRSLIAKTVDSEVYFQFAEVLMKSKSYNDAIDMFHRLLLIGNDPRTILPRLALCYVNLEQPAKAHLIYARLQKLKGYDDNCKVNDEECLGIIKTRRTVASTSANKKIA